MAQNPIVIGTALAASAAVAFGVSTPFVQRFGVGVGPFATAALLYLGAALGALQLPAGRRSSPETCVRLAHLPRLFAISVFGSALAPTLFAWGLQRVPATHGALLLAAEAVFTVGLAAAIHREHVGGRVALAVTFMSAGGVATVIGASSTGSVGVAGAFAVIAAVACWALDNVLTRPFAELDSASVVRAKAFFGVASTGVLAVLFGEPRPAGSRAAGLIVCGIFGYGASLRLYLLAQRRIGAGRTGSVFAIAPFVGALAALALGDRPGGLATLAAAGLFLVGLALHITERHSHEHVHEELVHTHAHTHDDGHHDHPHDTPAAGAHSHPHHHAGRVHAHPHGPDAHHTHRH